MLAHGSNGLVLEHSGKLKSDRYPRRENGKGCNAVFYHGFHGLKRISRIKWA